MRIDLLGQNVLGSVEGVYLNGTLVMPLAGGSAMWDFLTDTIVGFGGWDNTDGSPSAQGPGLYSISIANPGTPTLLGRFNAANAVAFCTDGRSKWAAGYSDGTIADSDGNTWQGALLASSRQGDWIYRSPDNLSIVVRDAGGNTTSYSAQAIAACMDKRVLLYGVPGASLQAQNAPTPALAGFMPFAIQPSGQGILGGYALGGKLCAAAWADTPTGWLLDGVNDNMNAAVAYRPSDGLTIVACGVNAGETGQPRVFALDLQNQRFNVNNGPWQALTPVNLVSGDVPPVEPPSPVEPTPSPIPPPTIPSAPIEEQDMTPTVGQKGAYRAFGSSDPWTKATVAAHQDAGYVALQKVNGAYVRFNDQTGQEDGETTNPPGYSERTSFDGGNVCLARPGGPAGPDLALGVLEWVNLS